MADTKPRVSKAALGRISQYLNFLKKMPEEGSPYVSSTMIADELGLNQVQVRKDLACVGNGGKPKIGYKRTELVSDIEHFLGYDDTFDAVLVGAGNLGKALLAYGNFKKYGLNIVAAFDRDKNIVGSQIAGKTVYSLDSLEEISRSLNVMIGIITVPAGEAQGVCDRLTSSGIRAIWNFAPEVLSAPKTVVIKNEDMAASLAVLSKMLKENMTDYGA
jgi:AT-rich DNA-binding protein